MCPAAHRIPYGVSLRDQCAHWSWQSVTPVPLGAVSEADWGIPCRHSLYPSVGATLAVARPTDFLQTIRRGGRLCPPAIHAGTPCHALRRAGCPHPADRSCLALPAGHTGPALQKCPVGRDPCVPPHTALSLRDQCAHRSWQSVLLHKAFSHSSSPTASSI